MIKTLRSFFSLESDIELADMITVLIKYQTKHKEFVEKLLEKKKAKDKRTSRPSTTDQRKSSVKQSESKTK